ncbi:glycosyltransferase family 8 protein [Nitratireductor sp. PBL-C9]|uniref:glycosyltransferase family 8 protein n=1 Tax=Nitratireductor sp. PBL-C9 TaxID=3435013 RepID=UPI003D7D47E6
MNAFYFVVDEGMCCIASAQALHIARSWGCDVHVFVERRDPAAAVRQVEHEGRIHYHFDALMPCLPEGLPSSRSWPHIVYLRLFAPARLQQYSRLIYLDADVLSMKPDHAIWDVALPSGLAAVEDYGTLFELPPTAENLCREGWLETLGISSGRGFNSGVLVIDPQRWREHDFAGRLVEYFEKYPQAERFDQDFLAWLFDGAWTELSPRFNFQASVLGFGMFAAIDPVFVHFCQYEKPWFDRRGDAATNIDEAIIDVYDALLEDAGCDAAALARPLTLTGPQRFKFWLRRKMAAHGFPSRKERRVGRERQRRIGVFADYVSARLSEGRFADMTAKALPDIRDETYFDGRFFRTRLDRDALLAKQSAS